MKIYTKTGDKGSTSLFGGVRVSKADPQIEAYGSIDELSSLIGLLAAKTVKDKHHPVLLTIQTDLHGVMAVLAGAKEVIVVRKESIKEFEQVIDKLDSLLPPLNRFILPGGTENAAIAHICRAVCRRSERAVVRMFQTQPNSKLMENYRLVIMQYLNRLSDLLFMLARYYGRGKEQQINT
jgi:cob(I)alamin adenosyltransferase